MRKPVAWNTTQSSDLDFSMFYLVEEEARTFVRLWNETYPDEPQFRCVPLYDRPMITRMQVAQLLLIALVLLCTYLAGLALVLREEGLGVTAIVTAWAGWAYLQSTLKRPPKS